MVSRLQRHGSRINRNRSQTVANESTHLRRYAKGQVADTLQAPAVPSTRDKHRGAAALAVAGRER